MLGLGGLSCGRVVTAIRSFRQILARVTGFQASCDVLKAEAAIGQQNDQVIDQVGGFIDGFLLRSGCSRQCQFNPFLTDFLRDTFRSGSSQPCRVTLLTTGGEALHNNSFEFGDECDVRLVHCLSLETDIDLVFGQVFLELRYRDLGAVKHTGSECSVDMRFLEDREEMFARTGAARCDQW